MTEKPDLYTCIMYAARNKELVREFDRLARCNLSMSGSPIIQLIDEATGKQRDDIKKFISFVNDCIYEPLLKKYEDGKNAV